MWQFPSNLDREWCFQCPYPLPRVLEVAYTISCGVSRRALRPFVTYIAVENCERWWRCVRYAFGT